MMSRSKHYDNRPLFLDLLSSIERTFAVISDKSFEDLRLEHMERLIEIEEYSKALNNSDAARVFERQMAQKQKPEYHAIADNVVALPVFGSYLR